MRRKEFQGWKDKRQECRGFRDSLLRRISYGRREKGKRRGRGRACYKQMQTGNSLHERSLTGDTTFVKQPCLLHANHVQDSAEMNWRAEI